MMPHQQRVIDEKEELDAKTKGLQIFIRESPHFNTLPLDEQWRLTSQSHIMVQYSAILGERIKQFKGTNDC